jgi:large subunit ribosomal protein L29
MKPSELRGMTLDELRGELTEQERGLYNLRFRQSVGEDIHAEQMKSVRREIARIKTLITEKETAGRGAQAGSSAARTS